MGLQAKISEQTLIFKKPATTSRGSYSERRIFYLTIWNSNNPQVKGIGECAPLKGLSSDDVPEYETVLQKLVTQINKNKATEDFDFDSFPSIKFGLETALLDLKFGGKRIIYQNFYAIGRQGLPINGLIWMDTLDAMKAEALDKIEKGFDCIKVKIGALKFDEDCELLEFIRKQKNGKQLIIRVDANGSFKPEEAMDKLRTLKHFNLHSIEQPIQKGQFEAMEALCSKSPIPVALDEELIGYRDEPEFAKLLSKIKPGFIVLKPNLLGGFVQCEKWIKVAESMKMQWWITSALESNIGLNAIAQYTANFSSKLHQGLGTGNLYINNVPPYTKIEKGYLWRDMGNEVSDNVVSPDALNLAG